MTPEQISLILQQQMLIGQIQDATAQLEEIRKALLPQVKRTVKNFDPDEWDENLRRRGVPIPIRKNTKANTRRRLSLIG